MKRLIAIIVTILFAMAGCIGCKQSGTQSDSFITVDVTASYPKKELILQDFMDVEYIPLETNDEFLTSANIQAIGKEIIIFRNMRLSGDIFIFDRNGKGLRKINRYGQANAEYTNIQNIVLDEDNGEMCVNNTFSRKILVYDLLGNFKRGFRHKEDFIFEQIGCFDQDNLIGHIACFYFDNGVVKYKCKNYFLIISKQDGGIKEISIPYEEKKSDILLGTGSDGRITDRSIRNRGLIPYRNSWILVEISSDTIYSYSPDHTMKPFIVRTPSVQSMEPEIFLFPGVLTDRYYFMQTVKRKYDFVADAGFPRTDLMYDRQENAIFECVVYNDDFTNKKPMSLVYEIPMFTIVNNDEIAFMKRLEAYELVEAYEKGQLKGKLKEIAAELDEESNAVIMLAKYKKKNISD
jgi:hypothetical protein